MQVDENRRRPPAQAVVRQQRWFELGFSEPFLLQLFEQAGFTVTRIDCEPTLFGRLYVCTRNGATGDKAS